jgi:hypothetical protein
MYQVGLAGTHLWTKVQLSGLLVTNRYFAFQVFDGKYPECSAIDMLLASFSNTWVTANRKADMNAYVYLHSKRYCQTEVSGQLHKSTDLPAAPFEWEVGWAESWAWRFGEEINFFPLPGIEPSLHRLSYRSSAVLAHTRLDRLLQFPGSNPQNA